MQNRSNHRALINPSSIHDPVGFTHAVIPKGEKTIYFSGQLAWDKNFQIVGDGDLGKQTTKVYENIQLLLNEIDASWDHVVKTTIFTTQPHEYEIIGNTTKNFFGDTPPPAQTLVGVSGLALPEFLIEIEAIVVMDK